MYANGQVVPTPMEPILHRTTSMDQKKKKKSLDPYSSSVEDVLIAQLLYIKSYFYLCKIVNMLSFGHWH